MATLYSEAGNCEGSIKVPAAILDLRRNYAKNTTHFDGGTSSNFINALKFPIKLPPCGNVVVFYCHCDKKAKYHYWLNYFPIAVLPQAAGGISPLFWKGQDDTAQS